MKLIHGDIVYSGIDGGLVVRENAYIAVENECTEGIYDSIPESLKDVPAEDFGRSLIIPAFSDLHVHAPQYAQRGTGMDLLLPDWLNTYTFPEEAKFADTAYASKVYSAFAAELLKNGTLHANVFSTLHRQSTVLLAAELEKKHIGGFVGKVNMDINSPEYLCESTEESLNETEKYICGFSGTGIKPILAPRFVPACSAELMYGLGRLAEKYGCGVHSHIVESKWEAAEAVRLFPDCSCDSEIYEKTGLLGHGPAIFAHFIFPSERDVEIAAKYGAVTVHCPDATNNIIAGIMPAERLLRSGIAVTLGTDVGAGHSLTLYKQISAAVRLSKLKEFYEPELSGTISFITAFAMATRYGGAVFGKTGAFDKGYDFDALVIEGMEDQFAPLPAEKRLERFCYSGDDRNITAVFSKGERVL